MNRLPAAVPRVCDSVLDFLVLAFGAWTVIYHVCLVLRIGSLWAAIAEAVALVACGLFVVRSRAEPTPGADVGDRLVARPAARRSRRGPGRARPRRRGPLRAHRGALAGGVGVLGARRRSGRRAHEHAAGGIAGGGDSSGRERTAGLDPHRGRARVGGRAGRPLPLPRAVGRGRHVLRPPGLVGRRPRRLPDPGLPLLRPAVPGDHLPAALLVRGGGGHRRPRDGDLGARPRLLRGRSPGERAQRARGLAPLPRLAAPAGRDRAVGRHALPAHGRVDPPGARQHDHRPQLARQGDPGRRPPPAALRPPPGVRRAAGGTGPGAPRRRRRGRSRPQQHGRVRRSRRRGGLPRPLRPAGAAAGGSRLPGGGRVPARRGPPRAGRGRPHAGDEPLRPARPARPLRARRRDAGARRARRRARRADPRPTRRIGQDDRGDGAPRRLPAHPGGDARALRRSPVSAGSSGG